MRQIDDDGLNLISQWEGLYLTAYHGGADRPGLLTIGYGHTDAAGPPSVTSGMTITKQQAREILLSDLSKCEESVERLVKVPLTDNQFSALVSFVFNVGEGNFSGSTLLKKLNDNDYSSVPSELMKWTRANGVRVQGLVNRRAAEAGLWSKGDFVASQYVEPEAPATSSGATVARVVGTATGGATLASQVASAINGPVSGTVDQVKQVIDSGGDVISTTRDIASKAPTGTWEHVMAFVQSPKFLAMALVVVLLAWGITYYLRVRGEKA